MKWLLKNLRSIFSVNLFITFYNIFNTFKLHLIRIFNLPKNFIIRLRFFKVFCFIIVSTNALLDIFFTERECKLKENKKKVRDSSIKIFEQLMSFVIKKLFSCT